MHVGYDRFGWSEGSFNAANCIPYERSAYSLHLLTSWVDHVTITTTLSPVLFIRSCRDLLWSTYMYHIWSKNINEALETKTRSSQKIPSES